MYPGQVSLISPLDTDNLVALGAQVIRSYGQHVLWLRRITEQTPFATHTTGWDEDRQLPAVFSDGSAGVGWAAPEYATTRLGYLAPQPVSVGIIDNPTMEVQTDAGLVEYTGATVVYQEPPTLNKGDILVLVTNNRRFVVGDSVLTKQTLGADILLTALLEERESHDPIYSILLT